MSCYPIWVLLYNCKSDLFSAKQCKQVNFDKSELSGIVPRVKLVGIQNAYRTRPYTYVKVGTMPQLLNYSLCSHTLRLLIICCTQTPLMHRNIQWCRIANEYVNIVWFHGIWLIMCWDKAIWHYRVELMVLFMYSIMSCILNRRR